ncbi:hypothetical protein BHE74_00008549, partial [Ensete ventricosum]
MADKENTAPRLTQIGANRAGDGSRGSVHSFRPLDGSHPCLGRPLHLRRPVYPAAGDFDGSVVLPAVIILCSSSAQPCKLPPLLAALVVATQPQPSPPLQQPFPAAAISPSVVCSPTRQCALVSQPSAVAAAAPINRHQPASPTTAIVVAAATSSSCHCPPVHSLDHRSLPYTLSCRRPLPSTSPSLLTAVVTKKAVGPPRWRLPPRSLRTAPKERREISLPRKPISGHRTSQAATAPWTCADCTQGAYVDVGDSQMCIPYVSDIYGYLRSREVSLPRHRLLKSCRFSIYNSSFFLVSGEAEATGELPTWRQFRWESQPHDEEVPGGLDGPPGRFTQAGRNDGKVSVCLCVCSSRVQSPYKLVETMTLLK